MFRFPQPSNVVIRPVQYRDLDAIEQLAEQSPEVELPQCSLVREKNGSLRSWFNVLKILSLFPTPLQSQASTHVAELNQQLQGMIQVSPFNRTRSTWRVDRVVVAPAMLKSVDEEDSSAQVITKVDVGSLLIRFCLAQIWQARTWVLEIDVNDKAALDLYRHNGFQPLANMTYWEISADQLQTLAEREADLPTLLPVSNADAQMLYQLDTMSMPPLVRQVFDRHVQDFKKSVASSLVEWAKQVFTRTESVSGYVFEPQRKAAIGYFQLRLCRDGSQPHTAHLTVNPAYTWLYPELMVQMARITQDLPGQSLQMASPDYQPEREEYLDGIGASRIAHTLLMSRSVWHKVRETKSIAEGLQLAEMLQGLQPARKPVPGRISMMKSVQNPAPEQAPTEKSTPPKNVQELINRASQEPHREDPCC